MKKILSFLLLTYSFSVFAQQKSPVKVNTLDVSYTYGNILNHNSIILHLITGHPEGVLLKWNRKTFGKKLWEEYFNYPDVGVSLRYHNLKNNTLGNVYALYTHYNFYFLKRHLVVSTGLGMAYATHPYNRTDNYKNVAFGSSLLSSTFLQLNYKKESLFKTPIGVQTGIEIAHYSNGNYKSPNASINVISATAGFTYNLKHEKAYTYVSSVLDKKSFKEPMAYNLTFSSGINQSDIKGMKQYPFYIVAAYADKRIGRFSGFQFGAEVFFSKFLKEEIRYYSIAYPERKLDPNTDYKRVGIFVGHELWVNKMTFITQIGYYAYYPYAFEMRIYSRLGLKRYFGKRYFGMINLKLHAAAAEAIEFGIGIRLQKQNK